MDTEVNILVAEDDQGHATLIEKNLQRSGISNRIIHFHNGQDTLDFLTKQRDAPEKNHSYLLLLDIRMPKVDGLEVLRQIKHDDILKKIPVIMITTTDDPREVEKCHQLGCNNYITKPVDYEKFIEAVRSLGLFLKVVQVPYLKEDA